jgi:hypothetical protein
MRNVQIISVISKNQNRHSKKKRFLVISKNSTKSILTVSGISLNQKLPKLTSIFMMR